MRLSLSMLLVLCFAACGSGTVMSSADADPSAPDGSGTPDAPRVASDAPPTGCGAAFSFGLFTDNYSGQEGGLRRVFREMGQRNVRFLTSAGDTPTYERVRGIMDTELSGNVTCNASEFPWFPATGNHDSEVQANMDWWAQNWANGWASAPTASRLASQMPLGNFQRGPLLIQTDAGPTINADHGTMYSFDYENAHFVFVDDYEQGVIGDSSAGVWDVNGANVSDPTSSQIDWLRADLEANTKPATFVFGHVAMQYPCYNYDPPSGYYPCPAPPPPGWSEHNSNFHKTEFTQLLADHNVTAYFHGHDHVVSRMLIDRDRNAVYERKYWEVVNDPNGAVGTPSEWESLQGAGRVWQIDGGRVYTPGGSYIVTTVTDAQITFEIFSYPDNTPGSTVLWDTWTVPLL